MSEKSVLVADHVSKAFGHGAARRTAVDDVSMSIGAGDRIGLVGESGSGKSTLGRMLAGLERPTSGVVTYKGIDVVELRRSRVTRADFCRDVQLISQDTSGSFDPRRTLRDSIRLPVQMLCGLDQKAANDRVNETLRAVGIRPDLVNRFPDDVSGGQRQRMALARGLAVGPKVLICDEVVSALDVSVQGSVLNLLKAYCHDNGAGMVFISHGLPATAFVAQDIVVMYLGRVVENGTVAEVITSPEDEYTKSLLRAYRGLGADHRAAATPL
jgi:peptide/nickel transport system ATP-binding protein